MQDILTYECSPKRWIGSGHRQCFFGRIPIVVTDSSILANGMIEDCVILLKAKCSLVCAISVCFYFEKKFERFIMLVKILKIFLFIYQMPWGGRQWKAKKKT